MTYGLPMDDLVWVALTGSFAISQLSRALGPRWSEFPNRIGRIYYSRVTQKASQGLMLTAWIVDNFQPVNPCGHRCFLPCCVSASLQYVGWAASGHSVCSSSCRRTTSPCYCFHCEQHRGSQTTRRDGSEAMGQWPVWESKASNFWWLVVFTKNLCLVAYLVNFDQRSRP